MAMSKRDSDKKQRRRITAKQWASKVEGGGRSFGVKLPAGYEVYKFTEGKQEFDIIPFLAGQHNTIGDEGFEVPCVSFEQHRIPVGEDKWETFLCPKHWGDPCDACAESRRTGTKDNDPCRPQTRQLYLVNDKPGDKKNKLKILNAVYYNRDKGFGQQLKLAVDAMNEENNFWDLATGYTIRVVCSDVKFGSITRLDLIKRDYEYPDSLLDEVPCLDDCLVRPNLEEIAKLISGGATNSNGDDKPRGRGKEDRDEQEENVEGSRKRNAKTEDEDESHDDDERDEEPAAKKAAFKVGDYVDYQGEECQIKKISGDGTSLTVESEDGDIYKAVDPDECTKVAVKDGNKDEEEEENDRPTSSRGNGKPSTSRSTRTAPTDEEEDDEDEDDQDDDEEEEEDPPARGKPTGRRR